MSFMKKLCDVYDAVIGTDGALLPVGFIQKKIKYNIILSPSGEFVTAQIIPDDEQSCAVPDTPLARTGRTPAPFPLAGALKYLIADSNNKLFNGYVAQLEAWCAAPHAPDCLRVLLDYLKRKTLYADLVAVPGLELKYYKDETDTVGKGDDAQSFACFSIEYPIEYPDSENRLWMRKDVRESWAQQFTAMFGERIELCYVTGLQLPAMKNHPMIQGTTARLISAKDANFPLQFRGRFVADRSAATVSGLASSKAHSALRWLLNHQGFQKYDMKFIGWYTGDPALDLGDDEDGERPVPDTFESYINALFRVVQGYEKDWKIQSNLDDLTDEAKAALDEVVILGLQAATKGRMSVVYEQELPGNVFIDHVDRWRAACRWQMPHQEGLADDRPPTWREICEAVMGVKAVETAWNDSKAEKAATKLMRDLQLRLLHCVVGAQALPRNMVEAAFHRAVQPLTFTDSDGHWKEWDWRKCIAVACAMIREYEIDGRGSTAPQPVLDISCTERDYLYGRLLAVAHKLEQDALRNEKTNVNNIPTNAVRMMARFVQRPDIVWPQLYVKLIPYLHTLGSRAAEGKARSAHSYQYLLGQIEGLFRPEDIDSTGALSHSFLLGFSAQTRALWLGADQERQLQPPQTGLQPPVSRDALFGCLLAVADHFEWSAESEQTGAGRISGKDGRTNAMLLTAAFEQRPMSAWVKIHDKLIAYLEKAGVKTAGYAQRLIGKIEQGFAPAERLSDAPLGRGFLHGYLTMLCALSTHEGLDQAAWKPEAVAYAPIESREAAFGALLALENSVERRILDLDKPEEENRPSNAMRFLTRAAQRPDEVRAYLAERMRPYEKKLWYSGRVLGRERELNRLIAENHWNGDSPLGPQYLYYFYLYSQISF